MRIKGDKGKLRLVAIWDDENGQVEIITNNRKLFENIISELYKSRWQVEIFFKGNKATIAYQVFMGTAKMR